MQPRRWPHLPVGANFAGVGVAYTDKKIFFNPTLELEDVEADIYTSVLRYVRVLDVFGKSGRVDVVLPYATARWEGKLEGQPASVRRRGFMDPKVRFAVNLIGSPAQRCDDYRRLRINTIVGTAVEVTIPVGDYNDDRLLNLAITVGW